MEKDDVNASKRIDLLNIPVDIISLEDLGKKVKSMLSDGQTHQIIFINTRDLLRARRNKEFNLCVRKASLVIPISKGIVRGARFLKKDPPVRHMPFEFVIRLLGALEEQKQSLYLLGQKQEQLQKIESNLRASFPGLKIVGRYVGFFGKEIKKDIITAIKKASPSLLLVGRGLPGKDQWLFENRTQFNPGISLWCGECFDIFSGKKDRPTKAAWESGMNKLPELLRNPWKVSRVFLYIFYGFLLLLHRISRK